MSVYLFLWSIQLLYIAYVDYRHKYIEDWAVLLVILTALVFHLNHCSHESWFYGTLTALTINAFFFTTFYFVYKEEVFGQGDVLLMTAIGSILGCERFIAFFLFETMLTGLAAAIYMFFKSRENISIPLAPVYILELLLFELLDEPNLYNELVQHI